MISLKINGKTHQISEGTTLAQLLGTLGVDRTRVAVERNLDVVPRRLYDEVVLREGDTVEVVTFVGGG
jgi:thiamine biosynthesis protein ThiS